MSSTKSVEVVFSIKDGNACGYDFGDFGITLYYLVEDAFGPLGIQFNLYLGKKYKEHFHRWLEHMRSDDKYHQNKKWSFAIVDLPNDSVEKIRHAVQQSEEEQYLSDEILGQAFSEVFPEFPR